MEIKVMEDEKNEAMDRRELKFSIIQDDRTPSKAEIKKELCKKLNLSPDATIIVRVDQSFGTKQGMAWAHSYKSAELLNKFEPKFVVKRSSKAKAESGEAAAPEAAQKEEKKEKKEEKKE